MKNLDSEFFGQMTQAKPQPPGKTCSRERENFIFCNKIKVQQKIEINLSQPQCSAN